MNNDQNNNVIKPGDSNNVAVPVTNQTTPVTPGAPTQPVAPAQPGVPVVNPAAQTNSGKKQVNKKTIIILVVALLIVFFVYNFLLKGAVSFNVGIGQNTPKEEKKIELKLKDEWANKYALSVQDEFKNRESFDLAIYDLNFDTNPEVIVSYEENDVLNKVVYFMDTVTGNVSNSKKFANSSINILYSLEDAQSYWYLKVVKKDNYVTYTRLSKVIEGIVTGPDIDCTTDKLLTDFKNKYVISSYEPIFYSISKKTFEKDFTTIYERYEEYNQKVTDERNRLDEKYADSKIEKKVDNNPFMTLGEYRISYATFTGKKVETVDGERKETEISLEIKNDGTLVLEGKEYKYTTVNNIINVENGQTLTASADNVLTYSDYGSVLFTTDVKLPEKNPNPNNPENPDNN